jgi:hypothetical protein
MAVQILNKDPLSVDGFTFTATANAASNHDFKFTEDTWLYGGIMYSGNYVAGDWVKQQIIDIDNILGAGANYVVKEFVHKWFILPGQNDVRVAIPTEVPSGLYLRIVYTATGAAPDVSVNIIKSTKT